jgi:UDPglucose--hexose-1-phosphate uridylyltransferase
MTEMRMNPITGNWTIIATERAKRPHLIPITNEIFEYGESHNSECFFCYGNEHSTPPEVLVYRQRLSVPDSPGWSLRVVTNKYSAFNLNQEFRIDSDNPVKVHTHARGKAEVVIESPNHNLNTALFPMEQIELVLSAYRERYLELSKEKLVKYIIMFKNNGGPAGATLSHPHSQIIATPVIPSLIEQEIEGSKSYYNKNKRCVYCDIISTELKDRSRIIYENIEFLAFAPYFSRTPFETWIIPKFHTASYQYLKAMQIKNLAETLKAVLLKIYVGLENPPYNYFIHTSPVTGKTEKFYHWHMELLPRMTIAAGFELGTGMNINIAVPEQSAEYLRGINLMRYPGVQ